VPPPASPAKPPKSVRPTSIWAATKGPPAAVRSIPKRVSVRRPSVWNTPGAAAKPAKPIASTALTRRSSLPKSLAAKLKKPTRT
jgi:hypothetical protein